jgi:hypothetical protein
MLSRRQFMAVSGIGLGTVAVGVAPVLAPAEQPKPSERKKTLIDIKCLVTYQIYEDGSHHYSYHYKTQEYEFSSSLPLFDDTLQGVTMFVLDKHPDAMFIELQIKSEGERATVIRYAKHGKKTGVVWTPSAWRASKLDFENSRLVDLGEYQEETYNGMKYLSSV